MADEEYEGDNYDGDYDYDEDYPEGAAPQAAEPAKPAAEPAEPAAEPDEPAAEAPAEKKAAEPDENYEGGEYYQEDYPAKDNKGDYQGEDFRGDYYDDYPEDEGQPPPPPLPPGLAEPPTSSPPEELAAEPEPEKPKKKKQKTKVKVRVKKEKPSKPAPPTHDHIPAWEPAPVYKTITGRRNRPEYTPPGSEPNPHAPPQIANPAPVAGAHQQLGGVLFANKAPENASGPDKASIEAARRKYLEKQREAEKQELYKSNFFMGEDGSLDDRKVSYPERSAGIRMERLDSKPGTPKSQPSTPKTSIPAPPVRLGSTPGESHGTQPAGAKPLPPMFNRPSTGPGSVKELEVQPSNEFGAALAVQAQREPDNCDELYGTADQMRPPPADAKSADPDVECEYEEEYEEEEDD